jgi:hypothetical protein
MIAEEQRTVEMQQAAGNSKHYYLPDWNKILGTTHDQDSVMRLIGAEAWERIQRLYDQEGQITEQLNKEPNPELVARRDELARQEPAIIDEAMVRLRAELGQESFDRLDAWVYRVCSYAKARSSNPPSSKADGPASAAPAVRP